MCLSTMRLPPGRRGFARGKQDLLRASSLQFLDLSFFSIRLRFLLEKLKLA